MRARADERDLAAASVGLEHFGASADYKKLYAEFGITAERAAQATHTSLATVAAAGGRRQEPRTRGRSD
jgi:transketolase